MKLPDNRSDRTRAQQRREERKVESQERVQRPVVQPRAERSRPAAAPRPMGTPRSTHTPPPVISRGGYVGTPVHKKAAGKVRRQYYYTLNTPGAEIRLPSLPAVGFGWRGFSAALTLVLLAVVFVLWNAPQFQIETARIMGAKRIGADEILTALNAEGLPIIEANPVEMRESILRSFPELSSVAVQVGLPARLVVTVTERQPVMAWEQEGKLMWIDLEGYAFTPRGDPGVSLPHIQAEGAPPAPAEVVVDETAGEAAGEAAPVLPQPALQKPFMSPELIQPFLDLSAQAPEGQPVAYSPRYGLGWNDPQGWKVYFGQNLQSIEVKLKQYQAIVAELAKQGVRPSLISVEFLHAPFYRLEQ